VRRASPTRRPLEIVIAEHHDSYLRFTIAASGTCWPVHLAVGLSLERLPRYLLRRDAIFGHDFRQHVRDLGIEEVLSTRHSRPMEPITR